ncbi:arginyltransferase [Shewanella sp. 10N.286.52.B9]|uniref:arginyltransferase n=1 Tax=Shewanella sp. 10N.286.52.B9 TaxID=1880837 RepID=UPI000C83185B|nr:arginyltransferase [Shewanella sp. 10N.286.52.B9]PMG41434.1 arginyltransferase [Shewanella sp. 10N.286.52.B9]
MILGYNKRSILSSRSISVGLTQPFDCNYIDGLQEQLLVIQESELDANLFEQLLGMGFRRNGSSIYKPRCPSCQACQSIRVDVGQFKVSKRQKRTLKNNQDLTWKVTHERTAAHYQLYEQYIIGRHFDGPMYPPTESQFNDFLACQWLPDTFIEVYDQQKLIGVAVTDMMTHSMSAIYSYFDPEYAKRSLGSYMILLQCQLAQQKHKQFLYLGYQIDENRKMNYKRLYRPYQILTAQGWQHIEKEPML